MSTRDTSGLRTGSSIKGYKIVKQLGKGGFGITYLVHNKDGAQFVLKELFISPQGVCQRGKNGKVIVNPKDKEVFDFTKKRFLDEAQILQSLDHLAIVKVYEHFIANSTAYYVMEYLSGHSLQEYININGPLEENEAIAIIFPILEAVKEMHKRGLWHRDIKPENMMISGDRTVLIDFGTVKVTNEKIFSIEREESLFVAMTYSYAAPEQLEGIKQKVDHRIDFYALGGTLYYLLTGKTLYKNIQERISLESNYNGNHLSYLLSSCTCDTNFKKVIEKCMAFNAKDRPQNVIEIQQMLIPNTTTPLIENPDKPETLSDSLVKEGEHSDPLLKGGGVWSKYWFLLLPMIVSFSIAVLFFFAGSSAPSLFFFLVGIAIGFGISMDSSKQEEQIKRKSVFKIINNIGDTEIYINSHHTYKVGRSAKCDIVVPSKLSSVSREHVEIICSESHVYIRELKETQGTYVNGKKLTPLSDEPWVPGEILILVNEECTYQLVRDT